MNSRKKGWIFVLVQIILVIVLVTSSFMERKYFERAHNYVFDFLAFIFLSGGALIFMISLMNFRQRITPNPVPNDNYTLQTSGLYSKIRHPVYLAALVLSLGCICFFTAYYSLAIFIIVVIFLVKKMDFEEAELQKKFPEYEEYKKHTYRLVPHLY